MIWKPDAIRLVRELSAFKRASSSMSRMSVDEKALCNFLFDVSPAPKAVANLLSIDVVVVVDLNSSP